MDSLLLPMTSALFTELFWRGGKCKVLYKQNVIYSVLSHEKITLTKMRGVCSLLWSRVIKHIAQLKPRNRSFVFLQDLKSGLTCWHMAAEEANCQLLRVFLQQPSALSSLNHKVTWEQHQRVPSTPHSVMRWQEGHHLRFSLTLTTEILSETQLHFFFFFLPQNTIESSLSWNDFTYMYTTSDGENEASWCACDISDCQDGGLGWKIKARLKTNTTI